MDHVGVLNTASWAFVDKRIDVIRGLNYISAKVLRDIIKSLKSCVTIVAVVGNPEQVRLFLFSADASNKIYALHAWCRVLADQYIPLLAANLYGTKVTKEFRSYHNSQDRVGGPNPTLKLLPKFTKNTRLES